MGAEEEILLHRNKSGLTGARAVLRVWLTKGAIPMANQTETKNQTPKAENPFAAAQNMFAAFDPMGYWAASQQAFQKMMSDSWTRTQAWSDEVAAMETQMYTRANSAVDTWAQLAHDTINYTQQLSAQARKMSVDAVRKAGFVGA
jgi:hypothetical protein